MSAQVSGHDISSVELRKPLNGPWHAEVELSGAVTLAASVDISIDGYVFSGTVKHQRTFAGRTRAWIVGGKGGLAKTCPAQHYSVPNSGSVIRDVLIAAGETLSSSSALPTMKLPHWQTVEGKAAHALNAITSRAGVTWRTLDDGTVWVGVDAWAKVSTGAFVVDELDEGTLLLAADSFAELAKIQPGTTLEGQRIEQVTHSYSSETGQTRTIAKSSSLDGAASAFLSAVRALMANSATYLCKVERQNADGTLQLSPEDKRIAGRGLDNVPIRHGLPGFEVKVANGAAVSVSFDGGNPDKPYASLWTPGNAASVTSIEYKPSGISSPFVRIGDQLEATLPMGLPVSGVVGGLPFAGIVTVTTPLKAIISGPGNAKFLG